MAKIAQYANLAAIMKCFTNDTQNANRICSVHGLRSLPKLNIRSHNYLCMSTKDEVMIVLNIARCIFLLAILDVG